VKLLLLHISKFVLVIWLVSINKEQGMKEQGLQGHDHDNEGDTDLPEEDTTPDDAPEAQDSIPAAQ